MQIAICDDEKEVRELIGNKIQELDSAAKISFYESGEGLLLSEKQIDILFLDIHMPGKNGIETARELRKKNKKAILIFVTAIEEYVFQAFDVGAFHYLVKPFSNEKFEEVLEMAVNQYHDNHTNISKREDKYLMVKIGGTHTKVFIGDIIYAEVFNRKIILHRRADAVEYYGKMSELESQVGEDFFRSHRAYLIHFKYVEKYDATTIYLETGKVLMAKKNYPEFVKQYLKYNQRESRG